MTDDNVRAKPERRIKVEDRRSSNAPAGGPPTSPEDQSVAASEMVDGEVLDGEVVEEELHDDEVASVGDHHDYLDDLRRLQAEFENFKKQNIKRQTDIVENANLRLIEKLLPVLDNFERAVAHGEGGSGLQLVFKELRSVLEAEGLSEIEAEGALFDPTRHEAARPRTER
jgi:molecular chaperone GrpE